jgi:hypothetical protein
VSESAALPEEIERDVRALLRELRTKQHVEAFLVCTYGNLRVRSVGRTSERIGRYIVRACAAYEDLGKMIREDVKHAIDQAMQSKGRAK